jgi:predicted dehydrogenase
MSRKPVRVGVIGVGAMGLGHVNAYRANPDCELVALCDADARWVEQAQAEHGARYAFTDWEALAACDGLDAVSVCLPTVFHAPATLAALAAGKHVLCEKPMAPNAAQAQEMADAARAADRVLMIGYNQRLGGDVQWLRRRIDEGLLGDVYLVHTAWRRAMGVLPPAVAQRPTGATYSRNWFNERAMAGGVCTDLGSHVVDLALYLMGFPKLTQVVGQAYTKFGPAAAQGTAPFDADDHSVGFAKFANGASMIIEASFGCYTERERVVQAVYGDRGGAHRESGRRLQLILPEGQASVITTPQIDEAGVTPMDHFVACLTQGVEPLIRPEEGVAVAQVLDGIYASSTH